PGTLLVAANINLTSLGLTALQGDIIFNNITATGDVALTASGVITSGGKVTADDLTLSFSNLNLVTLATNVNSLTTLSGGSLVVNEDNAINVLAQNLTNLTVNAGSVNL